MECAEQEPATVHWACGKLDCDCDEQYELSKENE